MKGGAYARRDQEVVARELFDGQQASMEGGAYARRDSCTDAGGKLP